MRLVVLALALLFAATSAQAQTVPDLKGTWTGKARNLVYGANHHHPGASADASTPAATSTPWRASVSLTRDQLGLTSTPPASRNTV